MADSVQDPAQVNVYLGLGSNLGDRLGNLYAAIDRLSENLVICKLSSIYETEPVGYRQQPWFLNAVVSAITIRKPLELLNLTKGIESDLGRKRSFRNAPRTIDIDILFYGNLVIQTGELTIPHPLMIERAFVLIPLAEIVPDFVHPVYKRSVADLLAEVSEPGEVGWVGKFQL